MTPVAVARIAPFHCQAEDLRTFIALYDERDSSERQAMPVTVVGPSENAE
jgi:hypothetical protein